MGEGVGAGVAELHGCGGDEGRRQDRGRGDSRDPAVSHDDLCPPRPHATCAILTAGVTVIESRADRRQDDRQQGESDRDADEGDQHAGDPDAAQEWHGESDEREQRDRDGRAAEDDRGARVLHRVAHGGVVAHPVRLALLAPARHHDERVVDRDPEADQADEELDDDRDVGDARERPEQQEGRRDRDERHQQRHHGHERGEHERENHERADRSGQRLHEDAGARLRIARSGAQRVEAGHVDVSPADRDAGERDLRRARLGLALADASERRDVDESERRAAVIRDERPAASTHTTPRVPAATHAGPWRARP